jgi:hypothetical protein
MEKGKSNLTDFLLQLSDAQDLLASFWRDPEDAMEKAGLTKEERELVLSGDLRALRERLQQLEVGADVILFRPVTRPAPVTVPWPWPVTYPAPYPVTQPESGDH